LHYSAYLSWSIIADSAAEAWAIEKRAGPVARP
jgi:hypothetical protein